MKATQQYFTTTESLASINFSLTNSDQGCNDSTEFSINIKYNPLLEMNPTPLHSITLGNLSTYQKDILFKPIQDINDGEYPIEFEIINLRDPSMATRKTVYLKKDTQAPTTPSALFITTKKAVELNWQESQDNFNSINYMIYRDGKNIAQTSSPYFIDQSAQKGSIYTYSIIAIDGAGNQSPQSSSITGFGVTGKDDTESSTSIKGNGNKGKKNN